MATTEVDVAMDAAEVVEVVEVAEVAAVTPEVVDADVAFPEPQPAHSRITAAPANAAALAADVGPRRKAKMIQADGFGLRQPDPQA